LLQRIHNSITEVFMHSVRWWFLLWLVIQGWKTRGLEMLLFVCVFSASDTLGQFWAELPTLHCIRLAHACPSFTRLRNLRRTAWHDVPLSIFPAEWITSLQTR
jgi:hypothetical protein